MDYFENRFAGKVILITGGTSGIGAATAKRAAKEGAKVVIVGRNRERGNAVLADIRAEEGDGIFLELDLTAEDSARTMVAETVEAFGQLDIAINNAGTMGKSVQAHEATFEDVDHVMRTNFYSVFFCCKYELQQFLAQNTGGVIVNVASTTGLTGFPGAPAYVSSKHAINGLTKNLALDYTRLGIRVNSVNPDNTDTPMAQAAKQEIMAKIQEAVAAGMDPQHVTAAMLMYKTKSIMQHVGQPEEQAAAILFLASDDASRLTGATLQTDAGWTSY